VLVKSHSNEFLDEIGLISRDQHHIHFMDGNVIKNSIQLKLSPVVRVSARWMYKDVKLRCKIADTISKKRMGLQGCPSLAWDEGMYFPYSDYTDVTFHQGMVPYSLDIIFMRDFNIIGMEKKTKVGSSNKWECDSCDGVIEVNGGFCDIGEIQENDRVLINAVSERDVLELEEEYQNDRIAR